MTLSLRSLLEARASLALKVGEDDLNVVYLPAKLTWEARSKLREGLWAFVPEAESKKDAQEIIPPAIEAYCAILAEVMVSWDAVDEKGKVLPIEKKILLRFPFDFILSLGREVAKDSLANPQIRATSAAISPTTGS